MKSKDYKKYVLIQICSKLQQKICICQIIFVTLHCLSEVDTPMLHLKHQNHVTLLGTGKVGQPETNKSIRRRLQNGMYAPRRFKQRMHSTLIESMRYLLRYKTIQKHNV